MGDWMIHLEETVSLMDLNPTNAWDSESNRFYKYLRERMHTHTSWCSIIFPDH